MKNKYFLFVIVVIVSFFGCYWYYSPYLALSNIRDAAQSKDANAFNELVDYPKVRESLKGQIAAVMAKEAASSHDGLAVFGNMLGMALVNPMVDALVRPESVMHAMQSGEMKKAQASAHLGTQAVPGKKPVEWTLERKNVDKIVAHRHEPDRGVGKGFAVVFERQGFAGWKLTEILMGEVL